MRFRHRSKTPVVDPSAYVAPTDVPPPTLSEMFAAIRDKLDGKAGADGKLNAVAAKLGAGKAS